jgi:hypothetical protein
VPAVGGGLTTEAQLSGNDRRHGGFLTSLDVMGSIPRSTFAFNATGIAVDLIEILFGKSTLMRR